MFDCVMPTRAGRHGLVFTRRGRLNLRNARFADDPRPVDPLSSSPMARDYSRAYWRHLTKSGEILAMMGLTEINLAYYQDLMSGARLAIERRAARRLYRRGATKLGGRRGGGTLRPRAGNQDLRSGGE